MVKYLNMDYFTQDWQGMVIKLLKYCGAETTLVNNFNYKIEYTEENKDIIEMIFEMLKTTDSGYVVENLKGGMKL